MRKNIKTLCSILLLVGIIFTMVPLANLSVGAVSLPAKFDGRTQGYMTAVRMQTGGLCWAYTAIACAETYACKNLGFNPKTTDFSERHLGYFTYGPAYDKFNNMAGDKTAIINTYKDYVSIGGTKEFAMGTLANGLGIVNESTARVKANAYSKNVLTLSKTETVELKDINKVKELLMSYGAAFAEVYSKGDETAIYNKNTCTINHSVAIVGWDDNYSRNHFSTKPSKNGAWICKNSWGASNGDAGYYYLSYEDYCAMNSTCMFFAFKKASTYENKYQYDGEISQTGNSSIGSTIVGVNAFVCKENDSVLKEVGFYTKQNDLSYKIRIYVDFPFGTNPVKYGTLVTNATTTGTTDCYGYNTVALKSTVALKNKKTFAIAVELSSNKEDVYLPCTYSHPYGYYNFVNVAHPGESWAGATIDTLSDFSQRYGENLRIKGITKEHTLLHTVTQKATCITEGISYYKCVNCSFKTENTYTPALGHSYKRTILSKPSNKGKGIYQDTCQRCSLSKQGTFSYSPVILFEKITTHSVRLHWTVDKNAVRYRVYRYDFASKKYIAIKTVKVNYLDIKSLSSGTKYGYLIRAIYEKNGKTTLSPYYTCDLYTVYTLCDAPTVKLLSSKQGKVNLSWKAVRGATKYIVYRKTAGTSWKTLKTVSSIKYCDNTVQTKCKYQYTVRAINMSGFKSSFKIISVKT